MILQRSTDLLRKIFYFAFMILLLEWFVSHFVKYSMLFLITVIYFQMIGIATEDADFTEKWNQKCRLGMDKESWALSCGGEAITRVTRCCNCYNISICLW